MFSKELLQLDRNTVQYMIDEMQEEIDGLKGDLQKKETVLQEKDSRLRETEASLKEKAEENARLQNQIRELMEKLEK